MAAIRSVHVRERVAASKTCEVYALGGSHVVKLYNADFDPGEIQRRAGIAGLIQRAGLAVPGVQPGLVRSMPDGRLGVVFDRVDGPTLLDLVLRDPGRVRQHARLLAQQHRAVHDAVAAPGLRRQKDDLERKLWSVDGITEAQREALCALLLTLPDGDYICHGDLSLANLIVARDRPMLIDWAEATGGNRWCDVARTWVTTRFNDAVGWRARLYCRVLAALYLRTYLRGLYCDRAELECWITLNAVLRLRDLGEPEQRAPLLDFLRPRLARLARG